MCTGMEIAALATAAGSVAQGYASSQSARAQASISEAQAVAERDAATQQADKIREKTRRAVGGARAAYAGAGVSVDSVSVLDATQDINQRGASDAYMALLTGERRARELQAQAALQRLSGRNAMAQSVLRAGGQMASGWSRGSGGVRQVNNYSPFLEGESTFAGR